MSRIGAVVVTHRTPGRAATCATSLRQAGAAEVVVVDSGSGDDSVARLRTAGHDVIALENLGFGRAANAGVVSLGDDVDVVIVCNADTVWDEGAATALAAAVREPHVAAAGPAVRYPDGRHQASARRLPRLTTALGHAVLGWWRPDNRWTRAYRQVDVDHSVPRDVDWLSGCAIALDRAAFTAVGGFDPAYFLYAEDVDLCTRLRARGARLVTAPAAGVVHEVGASTSRRRLTAVVHHARSLDRFAATHVLTGPRRVLRPVVALGLAAWAASVLLWERTAGRGPGRSTTGE